MTTEQQLIDAIAASPNDPLPRLIYADWLEERGSPDADIWRGKRECKEPEDLAGFVVSHIDIMDEDGKDHEVVITTLCGRRFVFHHRQDCCESVYIHDKGQLKTLEGKKLVRVEEQLFDDIDPDDVVIDADMYRDSWTWTDIKFETNEGTEICRWFGESNGYYSEHVDFAELQDDH